MKVAERVDLTSSHNNNKIVITWVKDVVTNLIVVNIL